MPDTKIHPSNLMYFAICLLALLAFFSVGIFPNMRALKDLEQEVSALNQKVEMQTLLYPVYVKMLQEITQQVSGKYALPEKRKISHDELSHVNQLFKQLADESDVAFLSAVPDAATYLEDMDYLVMNVVFKGDFFNLRKLLINTCQLPFLESIDHMRVETMNEGKQISFKIKIQQE